MEREHLEKDAQRHHAIMEAIKSYPERFSAFNEFALLELADTVRRHVRWLIYTWDAHKAMGRYTVREDIFFRSWHNPKPLEHLLTLLYDYKVPCSFWMKYYAGIIDKPKIKLIDVAHLVEAFLSLNASLHEARQKAGMAPGMESNAKRLYFTWPMKAEKDRKDTVCACEHLSLSLSPAHGLRIKIPVETPRHPTIPRSAYPGYQIAFS